MLCLLALSCCLPRRRFPHPASREARRRFGTQPLHLCFEEGVRAQRDPQRRYGIAATDRERRANDLPPLPGVFPDYLAPIVRNAPDGKRELMMARWGMPGPPQFGGAPVTNVRNTKSPHWRGWLKPSNRCVVPCTSFCEYADTKPKKTPTWFAFDDTRAARGLRGLVDDVDGEARHEGEPD